MKAHATEASSDPGAASESGASQSATTVPNGEDAKAVRRPVKKAEAKKDDDSIAAAGPNPGEKTTRPAAKPADKPDNAKRGNTVRRDDSKRKTDPAAAPKSSAVGSSAGGAAT